MVPSAATLHTSTEKSDADLVGLIRSGDRGAGAALVERHAGLVRSAVARLGKLPARVDHQDLVQAGRLALCRAATSPPPAGWDPAGRAKFSTFAYQAVWWAMLRELRAAGRTLLDSDLGPDEGLAVTAAPPSGGGPRPAPAVGVLLAGLPERDAALLSMVYGLGREAVSIHEAARVLGLSYSGCRGRLVRALGRIRAGAELAGWSRDQFTGGDGVTDQQDLDRLADDGCPNDGDDERQGGLVTVAKL